mmetsp:Transcript_135292/g.431987  ORF Transcript_135292/g.431987 Transcript_135292/m.431987 type:complete len:368 (-) Transcript_135292:325-1428(-)
MAPELLRGAHRTIATDVYAFGVVLVEVISREEPYQGEDFKEVLEAVADPALEKRPDVPPTCGQEVAVTMRDCWRADPALRPSFEELAKRLKCMNPSSIGQVDIIKGGRQETRRVSSIVARGRADNDHALLYDVFPKHVADALRAGKKVAPELKDIVTIFFSDIVGFTDISATLAPEKVCRMLDRLYSKFDALSYQRSVFKVETIGDAYMAVTNLVEDQSDSHAERIARFALEAVALAQETLIDEEDPSRGYINIRVGFHSGPVVANVVGTRNLRYCLFGDTVNTASRMESMSAKNSVHCSRRAADALRQQAPDIQLFSRGWIMVKGKGEMETFWVGFKPSQGAESSPPAESRQQMMMSPSVSVRIEL